MDFEALKIKNLYNMDETIAKDLFEGLEYPWEALPKIGDFIKMLGSTLSEELYDKVGEDVWIAKDAKVFPSAYIHGPAIIGRGAEVRHCAFIRGNAIVGEGAVVRILLVQNLLELTAFIHRTDQLPAPHPFALTGVIVDIAGVVAGDHRFVSERDSRIHVVFGKGSYLNRIGTDMLGIEKIHTDADRNIQKDHAEDDDAQIDIQRSAILSDIAGIMLSLQ